MHDSELLHKIIGWVRQVVSVVGLLAFAGGLAAGVNAHWDVGAWLMILGFCLMQAAGIGRPVFINVFQEMQEGPQQAHRPANVHDGYL